MTDEKETIIVLRTGTQLDIGDYTDEERKLLKGELQKTADKQAWLQIYCSVLAADPDIDPHAAEGFTDNCYALYKKRWAD